MVVLVDSSIWIDYFRQGDERLAGLLAADAVIQHPYVTAEIGMGSFRSLADRTRTLDFLESFTQTRLPSEGELSRFVGEHALFGTGLGFPDASLLLATRSVSGASLWTRDKKLANEAARMETPLFR